MRISHRPARLACAIASTGTIVIAPFAGPMVAPAAHLADSNVIQNCTTNSVTPGSTDLNCSPNQGAVSGAASSLPSEGDLTQQNEFRHH